jgi:ribonuclease HI
VKVIVEADGGSRGNPGNAGFGAVVVDPETDLVIAERLGGFGIATNNVAEYRGLIAGLQAAADLGADEVDVRMDSKLVVEQMSGRWQIKNPGLRPLAAEAAALVKRFRSVTFTWIPRERNQRADRLANAGMDGKPAPDVDAPVGVLGPAYRRADPAAPGPARGDRPHRAAALLRPRRRGAVGTRPAAGPRGGRPARHPRRDRGCHVTAVAVRRHGHRDRRGGGRPAGTRGS